MVYKDDDPQVVLVGNGSEVSTLLEAANLLKQRRDLRVQVVSVPSLGLFFNQPEDYRRATIPPALPAFALTAGLPSTLARLVPGGKVFGLDHFGASAPYKVLDKKFGFDPENVALEIEKVLK